MQGKEVTYTADGATMKGYLAWDDAVTGKRARSWEVCMLGSAEQVLKQAVYFAGACEGGSLKPGSRDCSPEAYIRRIRRLIEDDAPPARGWPRRNGRGPCPAAWRHRPGQARV